MGLTFVNRCPDGVLYIAWMYLNNDCPHEPPYGGFEKNGWYVLNYGDSAAATSGDLQDGGNQYYYYYAENSAGEVWAGNLMVAISDPTFTQCQTDDTNMTRTVGFRELDINGYDNYTLNFVCADTPAGTGTGGTGTGDTGTGDTGTGDTGTGDTGTGDTGTGDTGTGDTGDGWSGTGGGTGDGTGDGG
jgi:hypothetical protein